MLPHSKTQKELVQVLWSVSLGILYHAERAKFTLYLDQIMKEAILILSVAYIGINLFLHEETGFHAFSGVLFSAFAFLALFWIVAKPLSRSSLHMGLVHDYTVLHARVTDMQAGVPQVYIELYRKDLKALLSKEPKRYTLLNLYCNNQLIHCVPNGAAFQVTLPKWKVLLRNVYPLAAETEPYAILE